MIYTTGNPLIMLIVIVIIIAVVIYFLSGLASNQHISLSALLLDLTGNCTGNSGYSCYSSYMTYSGNLTIHGTFNRSSVIASPGFKVVSAECTNSTGISSTVDANVSISNNWLNLTIPCGPGVIAKWTTNTQQYQCQPASSGYGQQCGNVTTTTTYRVFNGTIYLQYSNSSGGNGNLKLAEFSLSHTGT